MPDIRIRSTSWPPQHITTSPGKVASAEITVSSHRQPLTAAAVPARLNTLTPRELTLRYGVAGLDSGEKADRL
jgi:hypothetical protein